MSEILPPEAEPETLPDNGVPPRPPAEFDIETSDAPEWAKELLRARQEDRLLLNRIERNQRIQSNEVRRISKRVLDHDKELGELRDRVESLEDWRDETESEAAE
jgi:hypothetical protein